MKNRLILFAGLILAVSMFSFVLAEMTLKSTGEYTVEVPVSEGWNLVVGFDDDHIKADSQIKQEDILVSYIYRRGPPEYLVFDADDPNSEFGQYFNNIPMEDINYIMASPIWIYSTKSGSLKYDRGSMPSYKEIAMEDGWNFLTITPEVYPDDDYNACYDAEYFTFNTIKGSCEYEKIYAWNSETQSWFEVDPNLELQCDFNDLIGHGMIFKFVDDCALGEGEITPPPALP